MRSRAARIHATAGGRGYLSAVVAFSVAVSLCPRQAPAQSFTIVSASNDATGKPPRKGAKKKIVVRPDQPALLGFDWTFLPPGTVVQQATLQLVALATKSGNDAAAHAVLGPWREKTLQLSDMPPISSVPESSAYVPAHRSGIPVLWELTRLVQQWV